MKKRLLSALLAGSMMLTMLPTTAFAAEEPTPLEEAQEAQQALVGALENENVTWRILYNATLSYNKVEDETEKEKLTEYYASIESLDLSGQNIEEVYEYTDVGVLVPFTGLKTLDISNTGVKDIGGLNGMTSLENLDVSANSGVVDLGALANKPIKDLNLSGTGIDSGDLGALTTLPLVSLDLSDTQISSIGALTTNGSNPTCASTLEELNISNTQVAQLQEVWNSTESAASLPSLKTLTAQGLELTSISGLVEITKAKGFDAEGITWNLSGSTLKDETEGANTHIQQIVEAFGDNVGFSAPKQEGGMPASLVSAKNWMNKLKTDLGDDGGKANLTWDTLITAVYWYETAADDVNSLTENNVKTACQTTLNEIKAAFENVKTLDMSGKNSSQYAISTGALVHFTGLTSLNLRGTGITEAGGLEDLTSLESLDLSGNKGIDNTSFGALVGMSSLKELNLSGTGITDIGGLTGADGKGVAGTLTTLDISDTGVTKLESIWGAEEAGTPAFAALKTLTAKNLALESISGLARIAEQKDFDASEYTWDLTGSTLTGTAANGDNLTAIQEKFGEKAGFTAPTYTASTADDLTNAQTALNELKAELESDDKASWDTLITAVYYYQQAQAYVDGLTVGEDKTAAEAALKEISDGFAAITVLDMSNQSTSQYAISTGALVPFTGLTELNLSNTGISETGGLVGLTNLVKLNLSGNKGINNTHFGALANMSALEELNLSGTGITDIGGLTGADEKGVADTLTTLDISDTGVTKLESVWNGRNAFPQLKTLTAKNLTLDSISGLVEIANGADLQGVTWNLSGCTLTDNVDKTHVEQITKAFEETDNTFYGPAAKVYTITFDLNGGQGDIAPIVTDENGKLTKLPEEDPTYEGHTFVGWFTAPTGGEEITEESVFTQDATVYAQWKEGSGIVIDDGDGGSSGGSGSTTYAVSVNTATNGTVSVSPRNASKGATVTITVTPNEGYVLGTLTATDANGDTISLSNEGDGKYTFTMPASRVTVSATFVAEGSQGTQMPFTDVASGEWYYEAVQYVYDNELMNGMSATTFEPNSTTTRGMIVTMLYRLENEPTAASAGFTDVAAGQWYTDAVNWAAANNIVNGYGDSQFGPTDTITREQMAAILYRYAQYKGYDVTASANLSAYTDAASVSSYAVSAMQWAVGEGLINGVTNTTLVPGGSATRAQVAAILMRFCENVAK